MQTSQFVLLIFLCEAPVLLREVTNDVILHWLSREFITVAVIALCFCQSHTSFRLLSKEAGSVQDSGNQISVEVKHYLFWNEKEGSGKT
jgi:hypothetical protein